MSEGWVTAAQLAAVVALVLANGFCVAAFALVAVRPAVFFALDDLPLGAISWIFGVPYGGESLSDRTDLPGALPFLASITWALGAMTVVV